MKKHSYTPISKKEIIEQTGACSFNVHKWRLLYKLGCITKLLNHNKKAFKPTRLSVEEYEKIEQKLNVPKMAFSIIRSLVNVF